MTRAQSATPVQNPSAGKRPRDLRLDFFRGLAMFIILLAHTPGNPWTLWIPARFGFSDATEIFVFCSGMASSLAFGAVFTQKSFALGTGRIAFRVWQVYWAHIGIFLVTAVMLFAIDHYDLGNRRIPYIQGPFVVPLFTETGEALMGLFTLTYVPGLFDILPMYLVILAMIPLVMGTHRLAGRSAVFALVLAMWACAQLAGLARRGAQAAEKAAEAGLAVPQPSFLQQLGDPLTWMNFPSYPWGDGTWFFNPFAWQLVFFTGFAFGMGWLPAPPVRRWLVVLAAAVVILSLPLAYHNLYAWKTGWLGEHWGGALLWDARESISSLRWKTWQGTFRYLHFLSLAYLAWVAVGPHGVRLSEGFRPLRAPGTIATWVAAVAVVAFLPHVLVYEIHTYAPGLEALLLDANWLGLTHVTAEGERLMAHPAVIGFYQFLFGIAAALLVWRAVGPAWRQWLTRDAFLAAVPVIRKVGTQSLAVFMVSIPLSRFDGWLLDIIGREPWTVAAVNGFGFAMLILTAYVVSWFKRQPWRDRPAKVASPPAERIDGGRLGPAQGAGRAPVPAQRP